MTVVYLRTALLLQCLDCRTNGDVPPAGDALQCLYCGPSITSARVGHVCNATLYGPVLLGGQARFGVRWLFLCMCVVCVCVWAWCVHVCGPMMVPGRGQGEGEASPRGAP